jgi:ABC-type nitrate/sulfonate/bicarbonate transport system substrate-binding protein
MEINGILYEDYGIKMLSNVVACKRSTIEKRPDVCRAFVEGMMDGLKFVYLNPDEALKIHLESVAEFKNATVQNQKVIEFGQACSTALGVVPAFRDNGLGFMDPALVAETASTVKTYMGVSNLPAVDRLYTNEFLGGAKLSPEEWRTVEARTSKYLPSSKKS